MKIEQLINDWEQQTHNVLSLEEILVSDLQVLLKETYAVLLEYSKNELVPKTITKLFLEIEDFLSFAVMMEEHEKGIGYNDYQKIYAIVAALKKGFFSGDFNCDFPEIQIIDDADNVLTFNLENGSFKDLD